MGRPYQILLPLLSLFLVRVDLTDLWALKLPVKVLKVYDGDSLLVGEGRRKLKVRLLKLDAPEMGQPFLDGKGDAGVVARDCLMKLLQKEKKIFLRPSLRDIYGRVLGEINDLSYKSIQAGCATLYPHASFSSKAEKHSFLGALQEAKRKRRGIWKNSGFRKPMLWRKERRSRHK